jgi:WD40 repeat protein
MDGFRLKAQWHACDRRVLAMDFVRHPEGRELLALVEDSVGVHLFDLEDQRRHSTLAETGAAGEHGPTYGMAYLPRHGLWPHLVTVGGSDSVTVFDTVRGRLDSGWPLPDQSRPRCVDSMLVSARTVIAAGDSAGRVFLWDWVSGGDQQEPRRLDDGHQAPVKAIKMLRKEGWMAVAHGDGVTVWDLNDGPEPVQLSKFGAGDDRLLAVIYDGKNRPRLASVGERGVQIWDPETGTQIGRRFAINLQISAIAAVTDSSGEAALALAIDSKVMVWSPNTLTATLLEFERPMGQLTVLAKILAGDGSTLLAAGDQNGDVAVWSQPPTSFTATECRHDGWINAVIPLPRGADGTSPRIAAASDDGTVTLWRLSALEDPVRLQHGEQRPRTQVQALAGLGESHFASGDELGVIRVWDLGTQELIREGRCGHGRIRAMASYRDQSGWILAAGGDGGITSLWQPDPLAEVSYFVAGQANNSLVRALAILSAPGVNGFAPDVPVLLAVGHGNGTVAIWDITDPARPSQAGAVHAGAQVRTITALHTADGVVLAAGGDDGEIRVWQTARREGGIMSPLPCQDWPSLAGPSEEDGHNGPVAALAAVTVDGHQLLASGGADKMIRLWDPDRDFQLISDVPAHSNWVRVLTEVSAGQGVELVSGGDDGMVRLWPIVDNDLVPSRHDLMLRGFADRPAEADLLNRTIIVQELFETIRPQGDRPEGQLANGPQVITVEGRWGEGKTSLMLILQRLLDEHTAGREAPGPRAWFDRLRLWLFGPGYAERELTPYRAAKILRSAPVRPARPAPGKSQPACDKVVTAWLNPWSYQSAQQVWAGLSDNIIEAASPALGATETERQQHWLTYNLGRLDRAMLRRRIYGGVFKPLLFSASALGIPVTAAIVTRLVTFPNAQANLFWIGWLLLAWAVIVGVWGLLRHVRGRATAYLAAELFRGPVPLPAQGIEPVASAVYPSGSGHLYWIQRDIHQLALDLAARGYQLVIFIDDLDRCSSKTTAEIIEAINGFLALIHRSGGKARHEAKPYGIPQFVMGLDPKVVASRLTEAYGGLQPEPDDSIGWAFLQKVSQLSVVLPITRDHHVYRIMQAHTPRQQPGGGVPRPEAVIDGAELASPRPPDPPPAAVQSVSPAGIPSYAQARESDYDRQARSQYLEGDPAVRAHLQSIMRLRDTRSMREIKRLITLWAFYVRLLKRHLSRDALNNSQAACDAMTLAEIICRWPAFTPALTRTFTADRIGLSLVSRAAQATDEVWSQTLIDIGLHQEKPDELDAFRDLLREHGNDRVVEYAYYLL